MNSSLEEQAKTMNLEQFRKMLILLKEQELKSFISGEENGGTIC
jgi:hypothetical protein